MLSLMEWAQLFYSMEEEILLRSMRIKCTLCGRFTFHQIIILFLIGKLLAMRSLPRWL